PCAIQLACDFPTRLVQLAPVLRREEPADCAPDVVVPASRLRAVCRRHVVAQEDLPLGVPPPRAAAVGEEHTRLGIDVRLDNALRTLPWRGDVTVRLDPCHHAAPDGRGRT